MMSISVRAAFVHGLCQALQKRNLPRALMTDNGSPMIAAEVQRGLHELGIVHETTLPYSPYQNAKIETFWALVESRLMAMLEGSPALGLTQLNEITQAWVELEYQRREHREIGSSPLRRFLDRTAKTSCARSVSSRPNCHSLFP